MSSLGLEDDYPERYFRHGHMRCGPCPTVPACKHHLPEGHACAIFPRETDSCIERSLAPQGNAQVIEQQYKELYENIKNGVKLQDQIKELHALFASDVGRIHFYGLDIQRQLVRHAMSMRVPCKEFDTIVQIFQIALDDCSPLSGQILDYFVFLLHKESYYKNIRFYFFYSQVINTKQASFEFLKSIDFQMLVRFYQTEMESNYNVNSQLAQALPYQELKQLENVNSDSSAITMTSSLSIDEDGVVDKGAPEQNAMSDRSIFSELGNQLFDAAQGQPWRQSGSAGASSDVERRGAVSDHMLYEAAQSGERDLPGDGRRQSVRRKRARKKRPSNTSAQAERYAVYGPMTCARVSVARPKVDIPKLDLGKIGTKCREDDAPFPVRCVSADHEVPVQSQSPTRVSKPARSTHDKKFDQAIQHIHENRRGRTLLQDIGNQVGEFIAMSDFPTINKMAYRVKNSVRRHPGDQPDVDCQRTSCTSQFTSINNMLHSCFDDIYMKIDVLAGEHHTNEIRFGVMLLINNLITNSPQSVQQDYNIVLYPIIFDIMQLRHRKQGFDPLQLYALVKTLHRINEAQMSNKPDEWGMALYQIFDYVRLDLQFVDMRTNRVVTVERENMKVVEKRTVTTMPNLNLLSRLEGFRRNLTPHITLLCDKLKQLCWFHSNLSAVEDISLILGILADNIKVSNYSYFVRSSVIEQGLPALLKLLHLIINKRIKSREYYIFVSHRLLYLFNTIIESDVCSSIDEQQASINQIFINIFILQVIQVHPWLKRYAYLILMNSRVKMELSGLFVNQAQCESAFDEIEFTFCKFIKSMAILTENHLFNVKYNSNEDLFEVDLRDPNISVSRYANLREENKPLGRDDNFDLQTELSCMPLHTLLINQLNSECMYKVENKQIFLKQIGQMTEKHHDNNPLLDFRELLFLIDYNIGVLMEFLMFQQNNVTNSQNGRRNYLICLEALQHLIKIPGIFAMVEENQLNKYITYHYISFLKFYKNNTFEAPGVGREGITDQQLAKGHLDLLLQIINVNTESREELYVIKLIDFLIFELLAMDGEVSDEIRIIKPSEDSKEQIMKRMVSLGRQYSLYKDSAPKLFRGATLGRYDTAYFEPFNDQRPNEDLFKRNGRESLSTINADNSSSHSTFTFRKVQIPNIFKKSDIEINLNIKYGNNTLPPLQATAATETSDSTDSDGWGEVAERLGIDLHAPEPDTPTQPAAASSHHRGPKMAFSLNLEKLGKEKVVSENQERRMGDMLTPNLKVHLLLARSSYSAEESQDDALYSPNTAERKQIEDGLHLTILQLIINLIINPITKIFDPNYVTQFPSNNNMINIPVILHRHLNNPKNESVLKQLLKIKVEPHHRRLLRLLTSTVFDTELYKLSQYKHVAQGAFGEVYKGNVSITTDAELRRCATPVAVKTIQLNLNFSDRCVLHDLYNEITVLEQLQNNEKFCQVYDYGLSNNGFYLLVMRQYHTSLRTFRLQLFNSSATGLRYSNEQRKLPVYGHEESMIKYMRILLLTYISLLEGIQIMHENEVIHFDIKSDNIFLSPSTIQWVSGKHDPNASTGFERELLDQFMNISDPEELPYIVTLGDFGESHIFSDERDRYTQISKGTEFNKSPEMLQSNGQMFQMNFSKIQTMGASIESDVWSAACTLFEILTGDFLFYDVDWIRFFLRVTKASGVEQYATDTQTFKNVKIFENCVHGITLIPEKRAMLGNCEPIIDLLEYELVEDPLKRPSIGLCIEMTYHVLNKYFYPKQTYMEEMFDFSIIGSIDQCVKQISEILTPKDAQIEGRIEKYGPHIRHSVEPPEDAQPSDVFSDETLFLGKWNDMVDSLFINEHNIQTVIDCSLNVSQPDLLFVSRIFRPGVPITRIFRYQQYDKAQFRQIMMSLEQIFDVIRCTFVQNGCVLIADQDGEVAANIAVACLMEFEGFHLYNAIIYLKRLRHGVKLSQHFLSVLQTWHDLRTKIGLKLITLYPNVQINTKIDQNDPLYYNFLTTRVALANYRCVCGRTFFVVKPGASLTYNLCNCVISDEYSKTVVAGRLVDCPSSSCRTILNYYNSLFGLRLFKALYAHTDHQNIISNYERSTEMVQQVGGFQQSENQKLQFRTVDEVRMPLYRVATKDGWYLYNCVLCGSPTHYLRITKKGEKQICLVAIFSNK